MTVRASGLRECFNRIAGLIEMRIGERRNQPVRPIQIVGRDLRRGVAQVGGRIVDVRVERRSCGEWAGTV